MKNRIRTLTLSVSELADIISVADEAARRQMLETLIATAADPDSASALTPDDTHPATAMIIEKIKKRSALCRRRRNARAARKVAKEEAAAPDTAVSGQSTSTRLVSIERNVDSANLTHWYRKQQMWLRRNIDRFFRLMATVVSPDRLQPLQHSAAILLQTLDDIELSWRSPRAFTPSPLPDRLTFPTIL